MRLARALPDVPRWVEMRSVLLSGWGEIFGLEEEGEPRFVVRDPEDKLVYVVGCPAKGAIRDTVSRNGEGGVVIAQPEAEPHVATALPGWNSVRAILCLLGDDNWLPRVPAYTVRLLEPSESLDHLSPDLRSELRIAAGRSPIAASLEEGHPVSFCYVASRTESLWDIAIDTLEEFRRRGHAARCVAFMIRFMGKEGLRPVWGAEEWNQASLGLAAKLGFYPVDELVVFRSAGAPWRNSSTITGTSNRLRVDPTAVLYHRPKASTSETEEDGDGSTARR